MSFFSGTSSLLQARASSMAGRTPTRSDLLGKRYQPFANPFFDHANTYLPSTVKSLFRYCRYYYMTHGIVNAICTRAAEYPITDIIFQHDGSGVRDKWEELFFEHMNYPVQQLEANLDYQTFGNAFISVSFPFRKRLKCSACSTEHDAIDIRSSWRYTQHKFWLTCPRCQNIGFASSKDVYISDISKITLIRWSPEFVNIHYNEATGRLDYTLQVSPQVQSQIKMGRKDVVSTMPEIFLQSVKEKSAVVFDPREVFHMRRANLSYGSRGWGVPMLMPVLKDAFYMQIMKKAQESILLEHIIPQNFIFPQPAAQGVDPFTSVDLSQWKDKVRVELARQRVDPAYTAIVPFPVGHQSIGGQGRALLLMPEIQQVAEHITLGMGFPPDLMFGNGNYAGTSVSMRMVENMFLNNVRAQERLMRWVIRRIGTYLGWPVPEAKFKPFRMADDLQRQGLNLQLNQLGKLSDTTLLASGDFDLEQEAELMEKEVGIRAKGMEKQQLMSAEIVGKAQILQAKAQAKAQAAMMQTQMREEAKLMENVQPPQQPQPPSLQDVVGSNILGPGGMSLGQASGAMNYLDGKNPVDMRPEPEVLPPRRDA